MMLRYTDDDAADAAVIRRCRLPLLDTPYLR